jgi:hypothetical protein
MFIFIEYWFTSLEITHISSILNYFILYKSLIDLTGIGM